MLYGTKNCSLVILRHDLLTDDSAIAFTVVTQAESAVAVPVHAHKSAKQLESNNATLRAIGTAQNEHSTERSKLDTRCPRLHQNYRGLQLIIITAAAVTTALSCQLLTLHSSPLQQNTWFCFNSFTHGHVFAQRGTLLITCKLPSNSHPTQKQHRQRLSHKQHTRTTKKALTKYQTRPERRRKRATAPHSRAPDHPTCPTPISKAHCRLISISDSLNALCTRTLQPP
jgi:hypothetical protein